MISWVCTAPPLVTSVVSGLLPIFLTKCTFAVDTHALCTIGFRLGFWRQMGNITVTGFQLGTFLHGCFQ